MLKLEQVSKIYSSHGVISTGFSKVSLTFEKGEFIAITGESGSGKSTLLNVISGLDSYEEGEMYIMGKPTSGFTGEELESYRKTYIGNIFQSFNLISSYTVYENIELVLLMSGYKKSEVKDRVNDIILKTGLSGLEKKKASKLSGGQKQRVAIARALAKETPVIVADEPTGNLDVKSAEEIIRLLHEISRDKLVIIVTHNYEQVEPYVTRKIQMHDGSVVEDKYLSGERKEEEPQPLKKARADALTGGNMLRLSVRNTFNLPAKFILLLIVFAFLWTGVISSYSSAKSTEQLLNSQGYNMFFEDIRPERYVISKKDRTEITEKEYEALEKIPNIDHIVRQDVILDTGLVLNDAEQTMEENDLYINVKLKSIDELTVEPAKGKIGEKENTAFFVFEKKDNNFYVEDTAEEMLKTKVKITSNNSGNSLAHKKIKVTGYGYAEENLDMDQGGWSDGILYVPESLLEEINQNVLAESCSQKLDFAGKLIDFSSFTGSYYLASSDKVSKGEIYIPEDIAMYAEGEAKGRTAELLNESIYFKDKKEFTVGGVYTADNCESLLGEKEYDNVAGGIYIHPEDYRKLFNKGNYQSSVFLKSTSIGESTAKEIEALGFKTLYLNDTKMGDNGAVKVINTIIFTGTMVITILVLFFICYFIIKLILKSRNSYFGIIRMLGATKKNCTSLLRTELFIVYNIAFALGLGFIGLIKGGIIENTYLLSFVEILHGTELVTLYVVMGVMTLLLAERYARKIFKVSAMNAYGEEV